MTINTIPQTSSPVVAQNTTPLLAVEHLTRSFEELY